MQKLRWNAKFDPQCVRALVTAATEQEVLTWRLANPWARDLPLLRWTSGAEGKFFSMVTEDGALHSVVGLEGRDFGFDVSSEHGNVQAVVESAQQVASWCRWRYKIVLEICAGASEGLLGLALASQDVIALAQGGGPTPLTVGAAVALGVDVEVCE